MTHRILDLLGVGERPVSELVDALHVTQPAVSKHLRVLREEGFVESRVEAQRRVYRLRPHRLREIDEWLAPYRAMWMASLDALERHLDAVPDRASEPGSSRQRPDHEGGLRRERRSGTNR